MYLLLHTNELLLSHECTCCCTRKYEKLCCRTNVESTCCCARKYEKFVRSSRYIRATAQLFIFLCAAAGAFIFPCAAAGTRATAQLFIFPCAAAGTFVRQHNFSYFRAQQQVHSCDSTTFQLFIFPCAAAGTFVRQHNFSYFRAEQQVHSCDSTTFHISVRSSRYIRAQQQLFRAQQQVHSCTAAARSCAAAGTFVRSSRSFVHSRIVLLGHRSKRPCNLRCVTSEYVIVCGHVQSTYPTTYDYVNERRGTHAYVMPRSITFMDFR